MKDSGKKVLRYLAQNVALVPSRNVTKSSLNVTTPEKHELEESEKNLLLHPALEIEEDDFVADFVDEKVKKSETEF